MGYLLAQCDAAKLCLPDNSVDLVIGSPPYLDCRSYGIGATRKCEEWVSWMLDVTEEALRVTKGAVIWVVGGATRKRRYQPGPEMLLADAWRRGWGMEAPCYWHRYGICGSGGDQWFRKNIEYCLCFKAVDKLPWANPLAKGKPPKFKAGGAISHRKKDGSRVVNGKSPVPKIANPGNLINTGAAGGGNLGDKLAHESEAPFPEDLVDFFIDSLCPPGGITCDPFSGSATVSRVCEKLGRSSLGFDLRKSQCVLGNLRVNGAIGGYTLMAKNRIDGAKVGDPIQGESN